MDGDGSVRGGDKGNLRRFCSVLASRALKLLRKGAYQSDRKD